MIRCLNNDVLIAQERMHYAAERLDFHDHFPEETVTDLLTILRSTAVRELRDERRRFIVQELFCAQRAEPHRLWELLLLEAVTPKLRARREQLGHAEDARLDDLVIATFLDAVQDLPWTVYFEDLEKHALHQSRMALGRQLRKERGYALRTEGVKLAARKPRGTHLRLVTPPRGSSEAP
jgi:hypothetical protein